MNYEQSKKIKKDIEKSIKLASYALQQFPKLTNGLTPDAVKMSPEFISAKNAYNQLFLTMKRINEFHFKNFKKEIKSETLK